MARAGPFGVLDIGTTKIACLIGRVESDGTLRVLGFGWQRGRGVRGGSIVDLDEAERAIRACVGQAEDMADTRLRAVIVNLTCGQPESRLFNVQWPVGGRAVEEHDIRRVVHEGRVSRRGRRPRNDPRAAADFLGRSDRSRRRSARPVLRDADRAAARHRRRRPPRCVRWAPASRAAIWISANWSPRRWRRAWRRWSMTSANSARR